MSSPSARAESAQRRIRERAQALHTRNLGRMREVAAAARKQ